MLLITIFVISLIAVLNYRFGIRFLYPPVVFCSVWAADLAVVWLCNGLFYPISYRTLMIFLVGCVAFSFGALLATLTFKRIKNRSYDIKASNRMLNALLLIVLVAVPLIYHWISSIAADFPGTNFFVSAYTAMNVVFDAGEQSVFIINLISLSSVVALVCVCERDKHGKRAILAIALAIFILTMTGTRSGLVIMIFAAICIEWMRSGKLQLKFLMPIAVVLLVVVSGLAIFIHKGDATESASLTDNLVPVVQGLAVYAAGGPPAFSQVVEKPTTIEHNWRVSTFFLAWANRFGAHYKIPPIHAEYVTVGPDQLYNVYSMYFAYLDWGYAGMASLVGLVGFTVTMTYFRALTGNRFALLLYGYFFAGMVLSPYAEYFFLGLSSILKLFEIYWIIFRLPVHWSRLWASDQKVIRTVCPV
jgi:oligosaccharide repeat unit polymerase